ncbi:MAG: hypothetical protein AAB354_15555 [candidate division KSB1 bacterium]
MKTRTKNQFPPGWDERRVREVLDHYENQTDEEAAAEDEAFRRREKELRRQNLPEAEIEAVLVREANEFARAGEPKSLKRRTVSLSLPNKWHERAKALAAVHRFSDYRNWLEHIVTERLALEDNLLRSLRNGIKNRNGDKRESTRPNSKSPRRRIVKA